MKTIMFRFTTDDLQAGLRDHKKMLYFLGGLFVFMGVMALVLPFVTAMALGLILGALILTTGVFQALVSLGSRVHWGALASAVLSIVIGFLMLVWPWGAATALATLIIAFLFIEGAFELFFAGVYSPFPGWGWMLASGMITLALAILVLSSWPVSAVWFLGVAVGVNFIMFGFSLLAMVRRAVQGL